MFIDEAEISVKAGDGGHGCVSFRREKFVPKGGPDGGDGGDGGSVFITTSQKVDTLLDFSGKHHWNAERGHDGAGKERTGKSGNDLYILVPPGTIVTDQNLGIVIKDLNQIDQSICVAHGGRGGKGNKQFATATSQTPRFAEEGKPGRQRLLKLQLKLIADIGLVGLPNAGKSTLLSRISAARPKIAAYPFTTIQPNLGIVELSRCRRLVVADIPGLIEGSHMGHGLGHDFLKHIERTRLIVHLVDVLDYPDGDPIKKYHIIRNELARYSPLLAQKPHIIVASKIDLDPDGDLVEKFKNDLNQPIYTISAVTGKNLDSLMETLWTKTQHIKQQEAEQQQQAESDKHGGQTHSLLENV